MVLKRPYLKDMRIINSNFPTECGEEFIEEPLVMDPTDADSKNLLSRCDELFRIYDRLEDYLIQQRHEIGLILAEISKSRYEFILGNLSKDEFKSYLDSMTKEERE